MTAPTGKRGIFRVTVRSFGFTGDGPSWQRNPKCRLLIGTQHTSSNALYKETWIPVAFGRRPGEKVVKDIQTNSGLVLMSVIPAQKNTLIRTPAGYPSSFYLLVP